MALHYKEKKVVGEPDEEKCFVFIRNLVRMPRFADFECRKRFPNGRLAVLDKQIKLEKMKELVIIIFKFQPKIEELQGLFNMVAFKYA